MDKRLLHHLASIYDRGRLVPLLGSGMSRPACVDWPTLVERLEAKAGSEPESVQSLDLISRADMAMRRLRLGGNDVAACVGEAVYEQNEKNFVPCQTRALARLFWPLVCTTNYDDVFLRAKLGRPSLPRVLGRGNDDCHRVLQHLDFPMREVVWTLQGFLGPRQDIANQVRQVTELKSQIVVGHAEYRRAANREPHFRRYFAEIYRNSSLLFLGAGLAEPYFRNLFDEIIELTGPPNNPHFAVIQEGEIDPDFMRRQYHIECAVYTGDHRFVGDFLNALADMIDGARVRQRSWGIALSESKTISSGGENDFTVVRATLPDPDGLADSEAVAVSCGRDNKSALLGREISRSLRLGKIQPRWCGDERLFVTLQRPQARPVYGIAAREGDKDLRTPRVAEEAFQRALCILSDKEYHRLHVQLLAAGLGRTFSQWISLVQMARAYGAWYRSNPKNRLHVIVYVVDPSVISLLRGGRLDLAEHLDDTLLRVTVMIVAPEGSVERYVKTVPPKCTVEILTRDLLAREIPNHDEHGPRLEVYPPVYDPRRGIERVLKLPSCRSASVEDLGLVSGSTLIVDYRAG